jgi:hypothetical protein
MGDACACGKPGGRVVFRASGLKNGCLRNAKIGAATLFPACGREGRPAKRRRGESTGGHWRECMHHASTNPNTPPIGGSFTLFTCGVKRGIARSFSFVRDPIQNVAMRFRRKFRGAQS